MGSRSIEKPPVWFWIVCTLAVLWYLMAVMAYLQQAFITEEALVTLSKTERRTLETRPAWATASFALAVWGGLLGSVALLLGKKWARPVLLISLFGILLLMFHSFFIGKTQEAYGPVDVGLALFSILVGLGLVIFAWISAKKLWLR